MNSLTNYYISFFTHSAMSFTSVPQHTREAILKTANNTITAKYLLKYASKGRAKVTLPDLLISDECSYFNRIHLKKIVASYLWPKNDSVNYTKDFHNLFREDFDDEDISDFLNILFNSN